LAACTSEEMASSTPLETLVSNHGTTPSQCSAKLPAGEVDHRLEATTPNGWIISKQGKTARWCTKTEEII